MKNNYKNILIAIIILTIIWITVSYYWYTLNKKETNALSKWWRNEVINQYNKNLKKYIWFVSTTCPHCQTEMPILDAFYRENQDKVIMQMIVVNGKKFNWDFKIPQDTSNPVSYQDLTKEECWFVPSYVIYDENQNIIDKKCWWALTEDELKEKLLPKNLESNQTQNMNNMYQTQWLVEWDLAVVMTTDNWKITIKMFPNEAPKTVLNFLALSKKWYYNWIVFHRVIKNFMIQWWDPTATWMWWESIFGKSFEDEFSPKLKNIRWSISMANSWPNTNWSQFFINQVDNNYLDWKHSVFWQVVEWLDNVDKIASAKIWKNDKPEKDIKIIKMEIMKFENNSLKPFDYNYEEEKNKIENSEKERMEVNKTREVKSWDKIKVNYTLTLTETKEKIDSSYDRWQTLDFTVWSWMMIPWFDAWVVGMKIWDKKTIVLEPKDAYWEYDEKNVQSVPKSNLTQFEEAWIKLEVWTKLPTQYWEFEIKEVSKDSVKVDMNHSLAWKSLTFDIEMVWFDN